MALTYPAVDFTVYGAGWSVGVPGWLQHLDGRGGAPLDGVVLAHGPRPELFDGPGPWLRIATVPRRRWTSGPSVQDPDTEVSFHAWVQRGDGVSDDVPTALREATGHTAWDESEWVVDGRPR